MFDFLAIGGLFGLAIVCFVGVAILHKVERNLKRAAKSLEEDFVKCPDCAYLIDKDARVCITCGWRQA